MTDASLVSRVAELQSRLGETRRALRAALAALAAVDVEPYTFLTETGTVSLSALFAGRDDLLVIHNMGVACANCTLWADGFNGLYPHVSSRAAFVVSSPDEPHVQAAFARERGWRFPMVSHRGTSFAADMGFVGERGQCLPGVSAFRKQGATIRRVSAASFQPMDDFCPVWHLFDLLPGGSAGWKPKCDYG